MCTNSFQQKALILKSLMKTSDFSQSEILEQILPFKLHDFGFRGTTSKEAAGIGGLAHLANFKVSYFSQVGYSALLLLLFDQKRQCEKLIGMKVS